ncbi:mechanosensitive ion channel domain-containing protein [Aquibium sp. ELW1220]|uniref:mechanosensitive ion channel domain-containing protein n=1 Tax=Aquibium sp. ELW1220 TaxID=2976766 RepID=UPI0025AF834B|nr:mechanosensitive ion channel domain-containing protein [Aquibium sp. ELW1220]MDN2580402.1 mechanosensitive ion channel [Aquibium sp. ELW1220]
MNRVAVGDMTRRWLWGMIAAVLLAVAQAGLVPPAAAQASDPAPAPLAAPADVAPTASAGRIGAAVSIYDEQKPLIDGVAAALDGLRSRVARFSEDDARLAETRIELEGLARQVLAASVAFRPRLQEINARLEQIGAPPGEGLPPEPEITSRERADLLRQKAEINALIGVAETLSVQINRLIEEIGALRRDLFARTLSKRYDIGSAMNAATLDDLQTEIVALQRTVSAWLRFVIAFKLQSVLFATLLALAAAAVLSFGGRRVFGTMMEPVKGASPSYLSRLSVAFWSTLMPSITLLVFLSATWYLYDAFNILRVDIGQMLSSLFQVIAIVFFVNRLARAALGPDRPNWRLVPVDTLSARRLYWLAWLTAVTTGADFVLNRVNHVMGSPLSLTIAKSFVATVIVGVLLILIALVRPAQDDGRQRRFHWINWIFLGLGIGTMAAALLGYIGFARFVSQQIVVTGAIASTMYIGFLSAGAISGEGAFVRTALGEALHKRFKLEEMALDQLGLAASIATYILVVCVGVPLVLLQWGFQWGDITTWAHRLATNITIGTVSFSLVGIATGIVVFFVGYFVTRGFQGWLDGSVLSRGKVDAGLRNSIRTAVGYAGIAIAALVGISAAGIDLSNLALVAGALSLGIGFGLQNIVSNFVSGLILLAERPFKAGDWIVAGAVTGTVKRISVRATEIETFQRQTVILPNSELINAAVGNWTHKNKLGRVEIKIGVAYGTDPRKVHALLLEIARGHPMVLKNPEPFVFFANFGESSLDFEIRLFLADITSGLTVQNDIRFAIVEAFEREGIEIPFPQRDLNLKGANINLVAPAADASRPAPLPPTGAASGSASADVVALPVAPRRGRRKRQDPDDGDEVL